MNNVILAQSKNPICNYCNESSNLVGGETIYPHRPDLFSLKFYHCDTCNAYVGTHKNSDAEPLGRLANVELRYLKSSAHRAFDPLWKEGEFKRKDAYKWLAESMNINGSDCHIGLFDEEQCKQVVLHVNRYLGGVQ
jgi:hypothetical protein